MISLRTSACKTVLAAAVLMSQSLALIPLPVLAADGSVRIAGQTVFLNKAASGGMTAEARAEVIQRNLDNALVAAKDRSPAAVNIVYVKGLPVITLGGYQVVTVDAANAKAAGTTPALLAQRWADALRNSLADSASTDSYIAQLNGSYPTSAPSAYTPPPSAAPYTPSTAAAPQGGYNPQGAPQFSGNLQYGQQADQYNRNTNAPYGGGAQYGATAPYGAGAYQGGGAPYGGAPMRGRVVYAPAGLVMPVTLQTSISTQVAQSGDMIQASLAQAVNLGESQIPAGSTLIGNITDAKAGGFLGRSGMLGIKFNRLRTPDGVETPISAHIVGGIGKYTDVGSDGSDQFKGETWKTKVGQGAIRGAVGAGTGAALGTAIGAIAGRGGAGAGRGAWSGAAIGGGLGVAQSLIMRKGRDVTIPSGMAMQVQLDAPVSISGGGTPPYTGAF